MFNKETALRTFNDKENRVEIISLIGNLTADPELRTVNTKNGEMAVISGHKMSVAASQYDKKDEQAEFFNYAIWGKAAEIVAKYAQKGTRVYFYGRYVEETNTAKDGKEFLNKTITVESFKFLSSNGKEVKVENAPVEEEIEFTPVNDEDIPF